MSHTYQAFAGLEVGQGTKQALAKRLLCAFVGEGCEVLVVKTRPTLCDLFTKHSLAILKSGRVVVYSVTSERQIDSGSQVIAKIRVWHRPVFHIVIGKVGFSSKLLERYRASGHDIDRTELKLREEIVCAIDPLDGDFVCYGGRLARDVVLGNLKEDAYLIG